MVEIRRKRWLIAIMVCSVIALTGCSGVQMEVDKSPGPQKLAGYTLTIGEPTTGVVFDGMYIEGQSAEGGSAYLQLRKHPEELASIREIRIQKNDEQMYKILGTMEMNSDTEFDFNLQTPIYPSVDKYRYRVEALNESGAVIDAVNITIVDA